MDPSPAIANWIWEFLLRQPLDNNGALKSLFCALPPPDVDNPNLKKLLLLKKLESNTSRKSVSENTLDLLALLADTDLNGTVSGTMRDAFCAAAVECTVNNLKAGGDCEGGGRKRYKLFEVVKSLWKGKIEGMKEFVENGGLGSEALWEWGKEIAEAIWDDVVYESVLKKCEQVNGVEAINAYIKEEREKMGPSFLEVVAERVQTDENLQRVLGVDQVAGKEASPPKEMNEGKTKLRKKQISSRGSSGTSGNPGEANIADPNETGPGPSLKVPNCPEAGECLQHSQAACSSVSNDARPTRVWDESIDGSQKDRDVNSKRSSRRRKHLRGSIDVSQEFMNMNSKKRRKNRPWSLQEEDVLRDAVEKHGVGNWVAILFHNQDNFVNRTHVDLKDKYRNLTKDRKTSRYY